VQLQVIRGKHLKDVTEIYQFLKRKSQQVRRLPAPPGCAEQSMESWRVMFVLCVSCEHDPHEQEKLKHYQDKHGG